LEFSTYRWLEHCGPSYDNHIGYRTEAEYQEWKAQEPISRLQTALVTDGAITVTELEQMDAAILREVEDAFTFAETASTPPPRYAYTDLYSEERSVNVNVMQIGRD